MSDTLRRESRVIDGIGPWLELRRQHVTASRMAALFDMHPFLSREQLATELHGESSRGDTPAMARGRKLEAAVIEGLREAHPDWTIERCRTYYWLPEQRIGATPDAFYNDDGVIECKTVHPRKWDEWHGFPPLAYILQTLTGMLVTGRQNGVLACMVLTSDYPIHEYQVQRHPGAEQKLLDAVAAWWQQYDQGLVAAPAAVEELESMLDTGEHLDWSGNDDVRLLLEQRRELKAEISGLTQRLGNVDYQIKNRFGAASTAWLPGYSLSFKRQLRREYTVPEACIRVLRIKEVSSE